jgi:hypothetical protein
MAQTRNVSFRTTGGAAALTVHPAATVVLAPKVERDAALCGDAGAGTFFLAAEHLPAGGACCVDFHAGRYARATLVRILEPLVPCRKTNFFLNGRTTFFLMLVQFSDACPEPVLVNWLFYF